MTYIDLRSDTVTRPSSQMLREMMDAELGDDVFEEDPTVKKLQELVSSIFSKEAALFVPSGTMANTIALKTHTVAGNEIICEKKSHIVNYEVGAVATICGLQVNSVDAPKGILTSEVISDLIKKESLHSPGTTLISLENTNNRAGGTIYPISVLKKIKQLAVNNQIKVHLDGARIWNAHIKSKTPLAEYGLCVDSISVCFSKGLGAPVGSCLIGSREFIEKARRTRKQLGGGMRQSGLLAGAAIYALKNNINRLSLDHDNAREMAEELYKSKPFSIDPELVETNILILNFHEGTPSMEEICEKLKENGVLVLPFGEKKIRIMTHLDVSREACLEACRIIKKVII